MNPSVTIYRASALSLVVLVSVASLMEALVINDCNKSAQALGKLEKVTISNCNVDKDPYCNFVRNTNASIEVEFKTIKPFETAIVDTFGKIGAIPIPFPMRPNDACASYGVHCPARVDEQQKMTITMPVLNTYPTIHLKVQVKLHDNSNQLIVCLEFPIKISK